MRTRNVHIALPIRVRAMLLVGGLCVVAAAGLISLWLFLRPVTLTIAVGSSDGDGKKIASIVASSSCDHKIIRPADSARCRQFAGRCQGSRYRYG